MNTQTLAQCRADMPLGPDWSEPEPFFEKATCAETPIYLTGLAVRGDDGEVVTGSAAALNGYPLRRCYYELLERTSIIDAMLNAAATTFPVQSSAGRVVGHRERDEVFPRSPAPERWRYARSNGIAFHLTWPQACQAAALELWERDRMLRSWYGATTHTPLSVPARLATSTFTKYYETHARLLSLSHDPVAAVGLFSFPRVANAPFVCGLGAAEDLEAATEKATAEWMQRLGFLWGEPLPTTEPPFSPTPHYHQEYYLNPATHDRLRQWLALRPTQEAMGLSSDPHAQAAQPIGFVDLTPAYLRGRGVVVKAVSDVHWPLVFGLGPPDRLQQIPDEQQVHPIA